MRDQLHVHHEAPRPSWPHSHLHPADPHVRLAYQLWNLLERLRRHAGTGWWVPVKEAQCLRGCIHVGVVSAGHGDHDGLIFLERLEAIMAAPVDGVARVRAGP